jgi:hypothetical protein
VKRVPRPNVPDEADTRESASEEVVVHPVRPVLPVVSLVIRLRAQSEVVGVDAQAVMAAVPDDVIPTGGLPVQHAEDEAMGRDLPPSERDTPKEGVR